MKTGIVLEGGAVRTIFSTGVCDALLTRDLLPDYVIGVSAGIAYGVSYVSKQSRRNLDIMVNYINDKRYMGFGNLLRRDNRAYFGLDFVFGTIPNELIPFDYDTFAAYPGEVEAVVTNLDTGKAEYFPVERRDDRFKLLQATCALPFLFPVFDIQGKPCMDGGAADAIPYERALEKGCERVIVVLTRERSYVRRPEKLQPLIDAAYRKYPRFCDTMRRRADTYNASRERLFQLEREGRALLFAPHSTEGFHRTEKDVEKIRALWKDGYDEGMERLDEVQAFLSGSCAYKKRRAAHLRRPLWIFQRSPLGQEQPDGVSQHGEEGAEHRCLGVALPRGELDGGQCGDGQQRLAGRPGARLHPTTPWISIWAARPPCAGNAQYHARNRRRDVLYCFYLRQRSTLWNRNCGACTTIRSWEWRHVSFRASTRGFRSIFTPIMSLEPWIGGAGR